MDEVPVTRALAEYRGKRLQIVFGGDDWVALRASPGAEVPDGFDSGESPVGLGRFEPWVKVPRSAIEGVIHIRVSGTIAGHTVSLQRRLPDGRIRVEFVGPPTVAKEIGLYGDQYMGWTGLFNPEEFEDIRVEQTRLA